MANLNRVYLIGRTVRDPELRFTPKGTAVAQLSLAINHTLTDEQGQKHEQATFVDVTLWARLAELANQYLKKGRPVFIEGRLQLNTWDDKQSGQKRSRLIVVGENLQFVDSRDPQGSPGSNFPPRNRAQPPESDLEDSDIPFFTRIYRDVKQCRLSRRVF